ncbi:MAG: HAD family hydrolase [Candidatus Viridilinea halotolerans]|uniref:HAD family hydrolase n=1 Tax=Candidatus Viridilinea halotolerans TaxID=2491704 RepID=A0A426UA70_9CHLR|nr:MAG: HAD family hydrolase [Candidatus Viridilinea halotolerans]
MPMAIPRYPAILFDLDGTLTDPYTGISRTFIHALSALGQPLPAEMTLRTWIGPPLQASFRAYLGDEELALQAVAIYRERYRRMGMYENQVYLGIPELLGTLQTTGAKLYVATSKLIGPAQGILDHFALAPFFHGVVGATPDERISAKSDVIAAVLAMLTPAERQNCVLVGDTTYDIEGARVHDIPCIAVSYGYGELADLQAAQPYALVHSVDELATLLLDVGEPSSPTPPA